ncbi:MAG: hypothetical protein JWO80_6128 [Bryobacterales bacterium]|nr:hypothetical protein [Bryobacterales bacterium]
MELRSVIEYLTQQRTALDETIVCLERLSKGSPAGQMALAPRKRGRKFMAEADRQKVSQRMKEYWAARRSQKTFSAGSH